MRLLKNKWFLGLLSSFLLSLCWWFPFTSMIGFVPILFLSDLQIKIWKKIVTIYLSILTWNVAVTWWVYNSSAEGGIMAFTANSVLMCVPIGMYIILKKYFKFQILNLIAFGLFWISFEYLHLDWDLSWPWLTLGNCFAMLPNYIQWYEFTGVLGGTLWILIINLILYYLIKNNSSIKIYILVLTVFILPIILSFYIKPSIKNYPKKIEICVVQPNVDPFTEKFEGSEKFIPFNAQLDRLLSLSEKALTKQTDFLLWPETALPQGFEELLLKNQPVMQKIALFVKKYPNLNLVTGIDSYVIYTKAFDRTSTARYQQNVGYYDMFNTALFINQKTETEVYHKSKLVPGVEQMPYPAILGLLEGLAINLGGTVGSLGTQKERTVFSNQKNISLGPIICYESIYGEFVTGYVKKGAQVLAIITNDAWWGNTPGHKQHLAYAQLRAIETRRSIARAANTGISSFILPNGDVIEKSKYDTQYSKNMKIPLNDQLTFYVNNGDFIGIYSLYLSYIFIGLIFMGFINTKIRKNELS